MRISDWSSDVCSSDLPVSAEALQSQLDGWTLLDFDDRTAFEAGLKTSAAPRTIALTYDDTTVTRGRLSQLVAMMTIKPACREMAQHPLLEDRKSTRLHSSH